MNNKTEEKFPIGTATIISLVCLLFIYMHWECHIVDKITLALLAIGLSPWLTKFFKKIKFGDFFEGQTYGRSQGKTDKPLPPTESQPSTVSTPTASALSPEAKRILATLWKYQKLTFKEDISKRWTFKLFSDSLGYAEYISGVAELIRLGLIAVRPENEQCMLTNEGIDFVEKTQELQNYNDIYKF